MGGAAGAVFLLSPLLLMRRLPLSVYVDGDVLGGEDDVGPRLAL